MEDIWKLPGHHFSRDGWGNMILWARMPGPPLRSVHVGFVVDTVALRPIYFLVIQFSPINMIPPLLHIHSYISCGMEEGSIKSRVLQSQSVTPSQKQQFH
jgi:hypothetical protein